MKKEFNPKTASTLELAEVCYRLSLTNLLAELATKEIAANQLSSCIVNLKKVLVLEREEAGVSTENLLRVVFTDSPTNLPDEE